MRLISVFLILILITNIHLDTILLCSQCKDLEEKLVNQILNNTLLERIWRGTCLQDEHCLKQISHCERNLSVSAVGWCKLNLSSWLLLLLTLLILISCVAVCCCWGQFTLCSGIVDCIVGQVDF